MNAILILESQAWNAYLNPQVYTNSLLFSFWGTFNVFDSEMPDCYEKSLKKVRCLLRFYIMTFMPNTPLMTETWQAIRDMGLAENEDEVSDKIK